MSESIAKLYGLNRADITDAGAKTTPASGDGILIVDSEDSGNLKLVSPDDLSGGPANVSDIAGGVQVHTGDGSTPGGIVAKTIQPSEGSTTSINLDGLGNGTGWAYFTAPIFSMFISASEVWRITSAYNGSLRDVIPLGSQYRLGTPTAQWASLHVGDILLSGALHLSPITKAALLATTPTATAGQWRITDQNNEPAYPDGTAWRSLATNTVIS